MHRIVEENKMMKETLKQVYRIATTSTDCDVYCYSLDKIAGEIEKLEEVLNGSTR